MALNFGYYPKDKFILLAKNRIMSPNMKNQQHARKFHSYFLVFIKQKSLVNYAPEQKHLKAYNQTLQGTSP